MTPQTIVGLVLLVLGVAVKVAAAAAWLPGDVSFIGEITNLGVLLLGKELMPASAAALKRTSLKPPSAPAKPGDWLEPLVPLLLHAAAMSIAFGTLTACAGSPADAALQNRIEANALRAEVNEASDVLAQAHGALPFVCAYLGPDSAACVTLEDSYRVLASAVDTAHRAIDLLDAVGVGAVQTRTAVERVLSEAETFGASVARAGEEVQYAIENHRRDRDAGGEGLGRGLEPSPEAAPAEDAGPQPAAAP